ncbi:transcription-repair coupling factor [Methylobacter sp. BBA5.1]|uniref:transcription-repair coupling factor n=1 Tax=Methylobacter sp. BBA5.1 TaxID=1495064 RepID=UPI000559E20F|nr:transcription-repair coupling factor [Methylobacter sp. BBA5.1]
MANDPDLIFSPVVPQKDNPSMVWSGLAGCGDALALASAIKNENRLFVVVTPDNQTALRLEHELAFFLQDEHPILHFPDWETLPYDVFSPLPEIISERLKTLALLPQVKRGALIVSVTTLMHRLAPREHVLAHSFVVKVGDTFNLELNRIKLESVGYQCVPQVYQHAEFAVRGSIVDLFPMGSKVPFRIELFDEDIESIRTFDPETQRSLDKIDQIELFPAREFPLTDESIKHFRQAFRDYFPQASPKNHLYLDVSKGITPGGIEYYLPLFVEQTATLFDYLPGSATVVVPAAFADLSQAFFAEAEERFQQRKYDVERPLLAPELLFLSAQELAQRTAAFARITIEGQGAVIEGSRIDFDCHALPDLTIDAKLKEPAQALQQFMCEFAGRILFVAESAGRREGLIEKLRQYGIKVRQVDSWQGFLGSETSPCIVVAPMDQGLRLERPPIAVITESLLSGEKAQQRRRRRKSAARELENIVNNLNELTIGSPVVHQEHGIGRYLGLQTLQIGGITAEFLTLEYANNDKLYVPVSSLNVIGRYTGMSPENAPLHKLGGDQWSKAKKKAIERIRDVAAELLEIHAKRAIKQGHAFDVDNAEYQAFADAFPFEETPDQQTAIEAILDDMASPQPMDRVICGDVGFGKTEVSMRAAFIAVQSGKQVAVLVPTTLLAQQHYQNFRDRFADWPVRVEVMSRFVTPKLQKEIAEALEQGKVDIVIGTHKLLSNEIKYKALGLVVIDEEHRFGVRQKEHFKKLRNELDMLTLTATPIPRTLNMAMSGLRDISIIASPPPNRHAIKTFISEWMDSQIREACLREIKRGGQVFFLHNDVKSMEKMALELGRLVPEARIETAHGQMPERELERIMLDFYHQRFNLLVCSTIIESGIDIPSANTMIINRADKLGLAQLHQLRGRVGRSHHRAYAYLIVPPKTLLSKDAVKRLEAVEASGDLGAGFMLSSHDLEIRGAGELLGDDQSGQIQEIGFTLYTELLERAVNALKSGKQPELEAPMDVGPEVDLQTPALIPEDYLPDIHARLVLYKRIASAETQDDLRELQVEMIDRFGLLPEPVKTLFSVTGLKQQAEKLGIRKIEASAAGGRLVFGAEPAINTDQLITLIQTEAQIYKFDGADKLRFVKAFATTQEKLEFIAALLQRLTIG